MRNSRGFVLIELVTVLAIAAILITLCTLALQGISKAGRLTSAGEMVDGVLNIARQNAITKNSYTALVVLSDTTQGSMAYRTFTTLELDLPSDGTSATTANWRQFSPWSTLPGGTMVDNRGSTFLTSPSTFSPSLPSLQYAGRTFAPQTGYAYQIFLPSGRLSSPPSPCNLEVIEGVYISTTPTYTGGGSANYFNLTVSDATGQAKISRP